MSTAKNTFLSSDFFYHFKRDKTAIFAFIVLLLFILAALFAPWLATQNPYDLAVIDIMDAELPPRWLEGGDPRFWLGSDPQGRDIYSTILYGLRTSLAIGLAAVALQMIIGTIVGLFAAWYGGWLDNILMRLTDIQLSFSTLMIAIIVSGVIKSYLSKTEWGLAFYSQNIVYILILIIGISEWPQYARTIRATALAEKSREYVEAAQVMGFGGLRIMFRHILPNCLTPILVISTVQIANAIMSEAALSYLGQGMPPTKPSLGSLISIGFEYINTSWWITLFPGLVLVLLVLAVNLLGDWLRDVFNPKLYKG